MNENGKDTEGRGAISDDSQVPSELAPFLGGMNLDGNIPVVDAPSTFSAPRGTGPRSNNENQEETEGEEGSESAVGDMKQILDQNRQRVTLRNALENLSPLVVDPEALRAEKQVWQQIQEKAQNISSSAKYVEWVLSPPEYASMEGPNNELAEFFQLLAGSARDSSQSMSDHLEQAALDFEHQDDSSSQGFQEVVDSLSELQGTLPIKNRSDESDSED